MSEMYDLVEAASEGDPKHTGLFEKYLTSEHASLRYWAAMGYVAVGHAGERLVIPQPLVALTRDASPCVAAAAALALCYGGAEDEGVTALIGQVRQGSPAACSELEAYVKSHGSTAAVKSGLPSLLRVANARGPSTGAGIAFYARSILVECGINTPWDLYDRSKGRDDSL